LIQRQAHPPRTLIHNDLLCCRVTFVILLRRSTRFNYCRKRWHSGADAAKVTKELGKDDFYTGPLKCVEAPDGKYMVPWEQSWP
jgi:hypothetical protein